MKKLNIHWGQLDNRNWRYETENVFKRMIKYFNYDFSLQEIQTTLKNSITLEK